MLGQLTGEKILSQLNANLEAHAHSHPQQQQRRYKKASSLDLKVYFLDIFLEGIREGPDKEPTDSVIAAAHEILTAHTQQFIFNLELNFGDQVLTDIIDSIPHYIGKLVQFGSCIVIDEALSSFFAPSAKSEHKLRHIPEKPHQDGMLTYILCQRLHYTGRPLSIAFAPTFFDNPPTACDALIYTIGTLERAGISPSLHWSFIADSLWSYPSYLSEFYSSWVAICYFRKGELHSHSKGTLQSLCTGSYPCSCLNYTYGFLTLQVYLSGWGVTHIVTNAAGPRDRDPNLDIPTLSYRSSYQRTSQQVQC